LEVVLSVIVLAAFVSSKPAWAAAQRYTPQGPMAPVGAVR